MEEAERWFVDDLAKVFTKHFKQPAEGAPFVAFVMAIIKENENSRLVPDFDEAELRRYLLEER